MFNIVIFGKPGSGKGTQADFLKDKYDLYHISTGDLFRKNILNKTDLGIEAKSFLDNGDLVPDIVTIKMLENEVLANKDANVLFLMVFQEHIIKLNPSIFFLNLLTRR